MALPDPSSGSTEVAHRALCALGRELAEAVAADGDAEALARALARGIGALLPATRVWMLALQGGRGRAWRLGHEAERPRELRVTLSDRRDLARGRLPRRLAELRSSPAATVVPLLSSGELVGALGVERARSRPSDAGLAEAVAAMAAPHLATALRIEETENRLYQLALVNVANRKMSTTLELATLFDDVVEAIQSTFGFDHVVLYRVAAGSREAERVAVAGRGGRARRLPLSRGIVGEAVSKLEAIRSSPAARGARRGATPAQLALPMIGEGQVQGVLLIGSGGSDAFDRGTVTVLETLASQVNNLLRNAHHFGKAQRSAEKLRVLLETSRKIARSVDGENILQVVADQAKSLLRANGCTIYKLQPDGRILHPVISREPRFNRQILDTDLTLGRGIVGSVVAQGGAEVINDTVRDPRALLIPGTPRSSSERLMVSPLEARGKVLGAMTLSRANEPFSGEDLDLFTIFAGLAADALFTADLHSEVRGTRDFLERVVDASADAIVTTDLAGRITLYSPGAQSLFGYADHEVLDHQVSDYYVKRMDEGRRIMKLLWKAERVTNYEIQFVAKSGAHITCIMSASLLRDHRGQPVGTLGISKDVTERVRLAQRLLELTIEDDLTGLHNARHFREAVGYEVRRARRQGAPLALFLFDIDGFKKYNDTRGHLAGDAVLALVGRLVSESIRSDIDKGFRYGGDEFVVLLPGAGLGEARRIAERIRRKIASATRHELTASVGLVALTDARGDARRFVRDADRAMYRAKRGGGDRVEVA